MSMKPSTGLVKGMLDTSSFRDMMSGMKLKVYAGVEPPSADAAIGSAVLLLVISTNSSGDPLAWEANAVGNVIQKNSGDVWSGVNNASGIASFCRFERDSDTGSGSSSEVRLQGDVGVAGRFVNLSSVSLTAGATQTLDSFSIAFPLM